MTDSVSPRTYPLGVGTLAIGTSGYSVTGLLPAMATHLQVSPASTGQLITVFAVTCALAGPPIAAATRRWERRRLLVAALAVTAIGNALAALAASLAMLFAARIVTALGTAVYTASAAAMAAHLNAPDSRARAMAIVFGGLTLALLLGVPASNALSGSLGYQSVFWLVAVLCATGAFAIVVIVPAAAAPAAATLQQRVAAIANPRVLVVLLAALLACTSSFAVYTYITAILATTNDLHHGETTALLACYGTGAALGNVLGGRITDRYGPRLALLYAAAACAALLLVLPITASTTAGAAATLAAWGGAFWSINPALSSWLVRLAPTQSHLVLPLLGSSIYLGMGLGGLLGGLVVAWLSLNVLSPIAGLVSIAACAVLLSRHARVEPLVVPYGNPGGHEPRQPNRSTATTGS